jgi:DNA repair protein RecO (recombination protein O)
MRVSLHSCFILHKRPYRETSFLLEVFSSEYGRISLVAKGVRKKKSNSQALYQSHRNLSIAWSGRGEMGTLTAIEASGDDFNFQGEQVIAAFYLNELLMRLLHKHESHPVLYEEYLKALTRLSHGDSIQIALRYFEKHLLISLGYGLLLDHNVETGGGIQSDTQYYYSLEHGPYKNKPSTSDYVSISGHTLIGLEKELLREDGALDEAKKLMRLALNTLLGDKPMASRDLYRAYLQQKQ